MIMFLPQNIEPTDNDLERPIENAIESGLDSLFFNLIVDGVNDLNLNKSC